MIGTFPLLSIQRKYIRCMYTQPASVLASKSHADRGEHTEVEKGVCTRLITDPTALTSQTMEAESLGQDTDVITRQSLLRYS